MRHQCRTKIIATLGPASSSPSVISALIEAGADVFRFNFSHGSHEEHRALFELVREGEQAAGRPIGILADLQGPKLRIGRLAAGPIQLIPNELLCFDLDPAPGTRDRVPLPHPEIFSALTPGVQLLLDDGKIRLAIEETNADSVAARVIVGGSLSEHKGVSIVGALLPVSALTKKDRTDLSFALDLGADWVALSFVQRPEDIDEVRSLTGGRARIMAKIEKPAAVDCLDDIVERADGIMIARGDLGVEMPLETVPTTQRRILHTCRRAGKPVVVATQMLESMIKSPTPTRAETSDVASAVYEGADAVMLSAESAVGKYPIKAVLVMDSVITEVEADPSYREGIDATRPLAGPSIADTICQALRHAAAVLPAKVLVTYTSSGTTSLRAARERPAAPILCLTPDQRVARQMALVWGTYPIVTSEMDRVSDIVNFASETAIAAGMAAPGDIIAIAAGLPFGVPGTTNILRIEYLPVG